MAKHPLDDTFEISPDMIGDEEEIVIPPEEERDLDVIIDFALRNYKELLDDSALMEPKSRLKAKELARDFLREAKDAMDKKEKLQIARERVQKQGTKAKAAPSPESDQGGSEGDSGGLTRKELANLRRVK